MKLRFKALFICVLLLFTGTVAGQTADSLTVKTTDTLCTAIPDSLTKAYLDRLSLPYAEAGRVPAVDSLLRVIRDEKGLFYELDSLGLMILNEAGIPVIDSLKSFPAQTLSLMRFMDSLRLPHRDTIRIPRLDSAGRQIRDSLGFYYQTDTTGLIRLDSLGSFLIDSLASFTTKELRQMARQKKREEKNVVDSIYKSTFHSLESYVVPDSLLYRRVISWTNDDYFNKLSFKQIDTNINSNFHDYAHMKNDVGAVYLGTAGSPALTYNFFKRKTRERFDFWDAGMYEAYDRETLPFYNAKSPFTVMSYAGTLFANKETEELNVGFLHTQNLSPATNVQFFYQRKGTKGLLQNEATNTRTLAVTANYLGKRYIMHAGFIRNSLKKNENGGISNDKYILDTLIDARTIPVILSNASSALMSSQLFINQSYGFPINIFKRDSVETGEGTMLILGHSGEWTTMSRKYTDDIGLTDKPGRDFYNNRFYLNPTNTADSVHTMILDNRFFLRLQPWSSTAIVSKLEGGAGYELLSNYYFLPDFYTEGPSVNWKNNVYVYAGASGMLKRYFQWNATSRLDLAGYYAGDMFLDANARFSFYPLTSGIHLSGRFLFRSRTPGWYVQQYYSNHYAWNNAFDKTSDTRIEAQLSIPDWRTEATFSYGLLGKMIYYDTLGVVRQAEQPVNVMTATLTQNFRLWYFRFDHRLLFQFSSNKEILPLPLFSANIRYYIEIPVVKDVMTAQIGADITFHTAYFMEAYNPALGNFHVQNEKKYGNTPYIDAFIHMKWKRATIYAKYINVAQGWPDSGYFSAPHYIRPQRVFKLGITWPFHIMPGKTATRSTSSPGGAPVNSTH
ncbi:MAG TPA: putative porin [Bacteroidales bacterium]|jgi:hypothetical protein|nr:putative porin [Bacteroidales bacterium]MCZ2416580.1 putative porin [Burkholderiales bacterium]OQC58734.1 MAG: hypothetical protein BWX52_00083 [Bacteroidetes bacterium ADurb.Bin013]MBP9000098.1 putative porin [Bacteroidales bacterium]MBV6455794.1 hypothetical protein [Bacteroidales bacterium]